MHLDCGARGRTPSTAGTHDASRKAENSSQRDMGPPASPIRSTGRGRCFALLTEASSDYFAQTFSYPERRRKPILTTKETRAGVPQGLFGSSGCIWTDVLESGSANPYYWLHGCYPGQVCASFTKPRDYLGRSRPTPNVR